MKQLIAAVALLCALTVTPGGAAAVEFGANDDTGKYLGAGSTAYFAQMAGAGLTQNVMTVRWDPAAPMTIQDQPFLDAAIPLAQAAGIKVVFAIYGIKPTTFTGDGGSDWAFAAWAAQLARTYPSVKTFIVGNEPNQPRFWRPQFSANGRQVSAGAFAPVLAATYDALKAVDESIKVVGVGLSPRGNDRPGAPSNVSTSPVRFLRSLGAWYRASGRTAPLMDALSFHPYPNANTDPFLRGYVWPNVGLANLDRLKQAIHDAFADGGHPTITSGLKLYLDEYGYQVATEYNDAYSGTENVPVTTEANQAWMYGQVPRLVACDPAVESFSIFGFVDEPDRGAGFQAGLVRRDGTPRPSLNAFRDAIETGCVGAWTRWAPAKAVIGAGVEFGDASPKPAKQTLWQASATAAEAALAHLALVKVKTPTRRRCGPGKVDVGRVLQRRSAGHELVLEGEFEVRASRSPLLQLDRKELAPGCYFYALELEAAMNAERKSTFVSRVFAVPAAKQASVASPLKR